MEAEATKKCSKCGGEKPVGEFWKRSVSSDGFNPRCIICCRPRNKDYYARNKARFASYQKDWASKNPESAAKCREIRRTWHRDNPAGSREIIRRSHLKNNFGLTVEQYDSMLTEQGGVCVICKKPETAKSNQHAGNEKRLSVDHDHATGAIRGLLCQHCNTGLGKFRDSPALLRAAADYVERHNSRLN